MPTEIELRYGMNPHQKPARVYRKDGGELPFKILRGAPGYVNLLDALNAWQLARELKQVFGIPGAASFKHVSPAGAAIAVPLTEKLKQAYFVEDLDLSPVATAYARARGADRLSSYFDFAAVSDVVDESLARLLRREVSVAIVAPGYTPEALEILERKKAGFLIVEVDPTYEPPEMESRDVFGVTLEQHRNDLVPGQELLNNVVTANRDLSDGARRDMLIASIALKYTQSNSICFAKDGQVIGVGAGQQNRLACTDLAGRKAEAWHLRTHPKVLDMIFVPKLPRPQKINAIEQYLGGQMSPEEHKSWETNFSESPPSITEEEKKTWLADLSGVSLSSDAYIPFRDNVDRAARTGVQYIVQTGGSMRDEDVIQACNEYGITMVLSSIRLFHH